MPKVSCIPDHSGVKAVGFVADVSLNLCFRHRESSYKITFCICSSDA